MIVYLIPKVTNYTPTKYNYGDAINKFAIATYTRAKEEVREQKSAIDEAMDVYASTIGCLGEIKGKNVDEIAKGVGQAICVGSALKSQATVLNTMMSDQDDILFKDQTGNVATKICNFYAEQMHKAKSACVSYVELASQCARDFTGESSVLNGISRAENEIEKIYDRFIVNIGELRKVSESYDDYHYGSYNVKHSDHNYTNNDYGYANNYEHYHPFNIFWI